MTLTDAARAIVEHTGGHLRVLGPPGSGKTALLAERFRWLEQGGRRPAVVTYTHAARERLTAALMPADSARFGELPVTTYSQIVARVLREQAPAGRAPLGEVEETAVLEGVVEDALAELESDYARIARSAGFQRTLLVTIHALLQQGLTAAEAECAARDARGRTRDVLRLFARYARTLESAGLATFYDAAWRAVDALRRDPRLHPLRDADVLLVDDFGDVDAGQFHLLEALAPPGGAVEVDVFGDPTGERFGFRGTSARFLLEAFPERYDPHTVHLAPPRSGHTALDESVFALAEALAPPSPPKRATTAAATDGQLALDFAPPQRKAGATDAVTAVTAARAPAVSVTLAADEIAEAQGVAEAAAALLAAGKTRAEAIAVIARDPHRYRAALERAFAERGVPFDAGRRRHHALDDLVDALLALLGGSREEHRLFALATSPWFPPLARALDVERGAPGGVREDAERAVDAVRRAVTRRGGVFDMEKFMAAVVRPLVGGRDGTLDARELAWLASLDASWSRYRDAMSRVGGKARIDQFRRLQRAHFQSDRAGGCVTLLSAREACGLSFAAVFLVGCAEGLFPALDAGEDYVPYDEIAAAVASAVPLPVRFHAARTREERLRDEHALLLSALTRATDALHVSAPREVQGEVLSGPAPVLAPLANQAGDATRARVAGFELSAAALVAARLGCLASGADAPDGALAVERAWLAPAPVAMPFALRRFDMSPSALDAYGYCQRKFFFTKAMRIDTPETIYSTVGSLFHALLERAARDFPSRAQLIDGLSEEEIARRVEEALRGRRALALGPATSIPRRSTRSHLIRMMGEFRKTEEDRVSDYRIAEHEGKRKFTHGGFDFVCRIDRVDVHADGTHIVIDYKTGRPEPKMAATIWKRMTEETASDTRYWQVPFYCFALTEEMGMPETFAYYMIPASAEPRLVVGFQVGEGPGRRPAPFASADKKHFSAITPGAISDLVDEAAGLAVEIFAERPGFEGTERIARCRGCDFADICDRRQP